MFKIVSGVSGRSKSLIGSKSSIWFKEFKEFNGFWA
jgi:hypothetical protein